MMPLFLFAAAALAAAPALPDRGITAPFPNAWNGVLYAPTPLTVSADHAFAKRLLALRQEARAQQAEDGGTLTPAHRAALQDRLDRIRGRYAEVLRRADLYAVDATGAPVYSAATRPAIVPPPGPRVESTAAQ